MPGLPDPLHPAVVHFPMALAALVPLLALLAALAIARGALPLRAWAGIVLLQALLVGSAWLALETGEEEEERVEDFVAEERIHEHEEAAEFFMILAGVGLAIFAAGLLGGRAGGTARVVALAASAVVLAAGIRVGHLGGELVYKHGAGSAYRDAADGAPPAAGGEHEPHEHD
jgi:uncharacterized membrane protein